MQKAQDKNFEDIFNECFTDLGMKTVAGIMLGTMMSGFFISSRRWPAILGGGFGVGLSYVRCEQALNKHVRDASPKPCFMKI